MKKIKIFLSIGSENLENDKTQISNFIRHLNDIYEDYNLYFYLMLNSKDIQEDIKDSELYLILFENNISSRAREEFDIAYESFSNTKKNPKIFTYVKDLNQENKEENVMSFLKYLDEKIGHFYNTYHDLDSVKLDIALALQTMGFNEINLETKENKLYLNHKEVLTLENIPIFFNNKDLHELNTLYKELERKKWNLREQTRINPEDDDLFEEYVSVKNQYDEVKKNMDLLEKNIFELERKFVEIQGKEKLSQRQIFAKKCLERGDLEGAKEALNIEELNKDKESILNNLSRETESAQILVNEYLQSADILKLDIKNKNRFKEIEKIYEEAIFLEEKSNLDRKTLYIYAKYLSEENQFAKAIQLLEQYLDYCKYKKILNIDIHIYLLIGYCYHKIRRYKKAEKTYLKVLKISEKNEDHTDHSKRILVTYYHHLASLYFDSLKDQLSLEYYQKAITLMKELSIRTNDILLKMASCYTNVAVIEDRLARYDESLKHHQEAIHILEKLIEEKQDSYFDKLGEAYGNYSRYLENMGDLNKSYEYRLKSIEMYKVATNDNPAAYTYHLVTAYNHLGRIHYLQKREVESFDAYFKAFEYCEELELYITGIDRDFYVYEYTDVLINICTFLQEKFQDDKAYAFCEKNLKTVIQIYEKLSKINHNAFISLLTNTKCHLISFYIKMNKNDKAKKYFEITKNNFDKIYKEQDYENISDIVDAYNTFAMINLDLKEFQEAKICLKKAENTFHQIAKNELEEQINYLIDKYNEFAYTYVCLEEYDEGIKYYHLALKETNHLYQKNKSLGLIHLILANYNLGYSYKRCKKYDEAKKYLQKSIDLIHQMNHLLLQMYIDDIKDIYNVYIHLFEVIGDDHQVEEGKLKLIHIYDQLLEVDYKKYAYIIEKEYYHLALKNNQKKQCKKSEEYYLKALDISKKIVQKYQGNNIILEREYSNISLLSEKLSNLYKNNDDHEKAKQYQDLKKEYENKRQNL